MRYGSPGQHGREVFAPGALRWPDNGIRIDLEHASLQSFLGRPLGELDLRAVCIDGKVFRDHCMVIELGIDTQGRKHVLGLREGATETAAVTTGLLSDLVTRGLPTDRTLLFLIDGAQGLRRAITDVFGSRGVGATLPSSRKHSSRSFFPSLFPSFLVGLHWPSRDVGGQTLADPAPASGVPSTKRPPLVRLANLWHKCSRSCGGSIARCGPPGNGRSSRCR